MWEMFSRRRVISLLGLPIVGFGAAATAPAPLGAEAWGAERAPGGGEQQLHAGGTDRRSALPSCLPRQSDPNWLWRCMAWIAGRVHVGCP